jgi:hypothetical protein
MMPLPPLRRSGRHTSRTRELDIVAWGWGCMPSCAILSPCVAHCKHGHMTTVYRHLLCSVVGQKLAPTEPIHLSFANSNCCCCCCCHRSIVEIRREVHAVRQMLSPLMLEMLLRFAETFVTAECVLW